MPILSLLLPFHLSHPHTLIEPLSLFFQSSFFQGVVQLAQLRATRKALGALCCRISWIPGGHSYVKCSLGITERERNDRCGWYGTDQRVWLETTVENLGTDWNASREVSLLSLPEGGMFVAVTRCSQVQQLGIPKEGLRHHRLIPCLHIFCFRYLVIGDQALSFVSTRM